MYFFFTTHISKNFLEDPSQLHTLSSHSHLCLVPSPAIPTKASSTTPLSWVCCSFHHFSPGTVSYHTSSSSLLSSLTCISQQGTGHAQLSSDSQWYSTWLTTSGEQRFLHLISVCTLYLSHYPLLVSLLPCALCPTAKNLWGKGNHQEESTGFLKTKYPKGTKVVNMERVQMPPWGSHPWLPSLTEPAFSQPQLLK